MHAIRYKVFCMSFSASHELSPHEDILHIQGLLELHHLSNPANHQSDQPTPSFQLLHKCLALYIRLCMHRQAEGIEGGGLAESLEEVLSWADRVLIHALQDTQGRCVILIGNSHVYTHRHTHIHTHTHKLLYVYVDLSAD